MTDTKDTTYDINFFKPVSGMTRDNNRIITVFIIIWFLAVFGFQFLLIGSNKMTPEESLLTFNEAWPAVQAVEADTATQQAFCRSLLMAIGKNIALSDADKAVLQESFSMGVAKLTKGKTLEPAAVAMALGLGDEGFDPILYELLPYSVVETAAGEYSSELPGIMEKYCTHPRGPLTEFTFLGFPFHYWYTAQLLLIIFVLLCLLYAIRIEKIHQKHNFVEEHT